MHGYCLEGIAIIPVLCTYLLRKVWHTSNNYSNKCYSKQHNSKGYYVQLVIMVIVLALNKLLLYHHYC